MVSVSVVSVIVLVVAVDCEMVSVSVVSVIVLIVAVD
jgi:hypothetical protein